MNLQFNSYKRALEAQKNGRFKDEIIDVKVKAGREEVVVNTDEEPGKVKFDKIPSLKPVFDKNGVVNCSQCIKH
ncbi:MAG: hypothetical protein MZV64_45095 [Ignavibacteriales bacterium]|nr:hypothetical protein [Ignavibacteriales bacterium]